MIMYVLLCYPVSIDMSQLLSTGRPISSLLIKFAIFRNWPKMESVQVILREFLTCQGSASPLFTENYFFPYLGMLGSHDP